MKVHSQVHNLMNEQGISVKPQDLLYSYAKGNFTFLVLTDDKSAKEPVWVKWVKKLTHMNLTEIEQPIESEKKTIPKQKRNTSNYSRTLFFYGWSKPLK